MYGEQHLLNDVLFVLLGLCHVKFIKKDLDSDIGGSALISARRNGMLLPVVRRSNRTTDDLRLKTSPYINSRKTVKKGYYR